MIESTVATFLGVFSSIVVAGTVGVFFGYKTMLWVWRN